MEAIAIVMSVLFALFLNDWWQDRDTRQSHKKTLILIQNELVANKEELTIAIDYYDRITPRIQKCLNSDPNAEHPNEIMKECCEFKDGGGVRTAHETAMLTGLYSYLESDSSAKIVSSYLGYAEMRPFFDASLFAIMTSDVTKPEEILSRFLVFSLSVRPSLSELLEETQASIAEVDLVLQKY